MRPEANVADVGARAGDDQTFVTLARYQTPFVSLASISWFLERFAGCSSVPGSAITAGRGDLLRV